MFPPLREGKKQKVAETDNFLYVLVSGYGPDDFFIRHSRGNLRPEGTLKITGKFFGIILANMELNAYFCNRKKIERYVYI